MAYMAHGSPETGHNGHGGRGLILTYIGGLATRLKCILLFLPLLFLLLLHTGYSQLSRVVDFIIYFFFKQLSYGLSTPYVIGGGKERGGRESLDKILG